MMGTRRTVEIFLFAYQIYKSPASLCVWAQSTGGMTGLRKSKASEHARIEWRFWSPCNCTRRNIDTSGYDAIPC